MSDTGGDDRARLLRALALSRRFHLFLVHCESPRAADGLVRTLAEELPRARQAAVTVVRLDPYEHRSSDAPLGDLELDDRVLIPLLSPPAERRAHGVVHVVDASRAAAADDRAWGRFFALWNEKRNVLQQLGGEVLVVLPEPLQRLFATAAPDVWSIRSGEYAITEGAKGLEALTASTERTAAPGWYRAVPPLALFGGDLLVGPWLRDIVAGVEVGDLVKEPAVRGPAFSPITGTHRTLRRAEQALAERRFDQAAHLFAASLTDSGMQLERALTGRIVALAAMDRADDALAVSERGGRDDAREYARWCAGRLGGDAALDVLPYRRGLAQQRAWALRQLERGEVVIVMGALPFSDEGDDSRLVWVDSLFLMGALRDAARFNGLRVAKAPIAALRSDSLTALALLASGDHSRASSLLHRERPEIGPSREPGAQYRALAFHAYASALVHADGEDLEGALLWLSRAKSNIDVWSETGLDRRSLHRASLAIDLAREGLDPDPADPVGHARRLAQRALALLGDTGEDFIARVLAVEAHRELARRLARAGDARGSATEAQGALDLARPLGGRDVPAWDALLAATEREAVA